MIRPDDNAVNPAAGCAFVLGARDPEMRLIAELLAFAGFPQRDATHDGKRVYPGNAYRADPPTRDWPGAVQLYAVECGWADEPRGLVHIDHHRPGDPGYGRPPAEYFAAASVGQVWTVLDAHLGARRRATLRHRYAHTAHLVAAADHCLGAAFHGECPGVDPGELGDWCITQRAAFAHRPVAAVRAELEQSRRVIRQLARDGLADLRQLPAGTIPEAPQAACREGIAVLSRMVDRDGRQKIGLLGASTDQVRAFLAGRLVPGLVGCYGDPARGFAGGYVPPATH